jgi:hypothetical protein
MPGLIFYGTNYPEVVGWARVFFLHPTRSRSPQPLAKDRAITRSCGWDQKAVYAAPRFYSTRLYPTYGILSPRSFLRIFRPLLPGAVAMSTVSFYRTPASLAGERYSFSFAHFQAAADILSPILYLSI